MKKSLLAAALALTATCAHAGDTAVLKVKASLTSNSCTPELSNDGVIDFGTVQVGDLSQTQTTQLGEKGLTLTITCPTPTVAQAYRRSVEGVQSGRVYKVGY